MKKDQSFRVFLVECSSVEVFVFGEEVVKDAKGRLQVQVDDIFGPGLWSCQSGVLHQFESQSNVSYFLGEWLKQRWKKKCFKLFGFLWMKISCYKIYDKKQQPWHYLIGNRSELKLVIIDHLCEIFYSSYKNYLRREMELV